MRKCVAAELNSLERRDNWENRWTYSMDISPGHNPQEYRRCSSLCWYENGKQGNESRTTPESYSQWPDALHPQCSHSILETGLTLRISPIVPGTWEQIHNHIWKTWEGTLDWILAPIRCEFNKHSLKFFRFVFSDKGISPDPKKVQAIHSASPPTSTSGVSSFPGIATYCAKFILKFRS